MKRRILSGCILAPFLILLYFGGYPLMAGVLFISFMGLYEFFRGFKAMDIRPSYAIGVASIVILYVFDILIYNLGDRLPGSPENYYFFWIFITVLMSVLYLFNIEKRKPEDALATMGGIFYIVFFAFHAILIDQTGDTAILVWLVVLSAFGTDICAYFAGVALGKHKLCPKISPKKTIEGSIGGIIGSIIACLLFGLIFAKAYLLHCVFIGLLGGIFSQFGDLTASIFKRKMGIKDYGNLIPGHGGILDRFDSVLFTAPLVYYYIVLVIG